MYHFGRLIIPLILSSQLWLAQSSLAASTVFKTTDENGNTVYTDQAPETAEEVAIDAPQTFTAAKPTRIFTKTDPAPINTGPAYDSLKISSPENNAAIRSNAGNLTVIILVDPALQPNHSIQLLVDGALNTTTTSPGPVSLTNLDRGTHQFQAQVIENESGEVLQNSNAVSITILRASVIPRRN